MTRIITVTSGKGGVGKTNISVNLSLQLAKLGYKTCLFDADFGLANINILLRLFPDYTLKDVILGNKQLNDIIIRDYQGIDIIPGSSGVEKMVDLNSDQITHLLQSFSRLEEYDFFIIDTAAGISKNVISFCLSSSEIVLVISTDPTSLTDAYALLKVLSLNKHYESVMVVINQSPGIKKAKSAYGKLSVTSNKYLSIKLIPLGIISMDKHVVSAVENQKPFIELYPNSSASKSIKMITENLAKRESPGIETLTIETFWEKCLNIFKRPIKVGTGQEEKKQDKTELPRQKNQDPVVMVEGPTDLDPQKPGNEAETVSESHNLPQETNRILGMVMEGISSIATELKSIRQLMEDKTTIKENVVEDSVTSNSLKEDAISKKLVIDQLTDTLTDFSMFQVLDDHEIRDIASWMKYKTFHPGDTLVQNGEKGKALFIIVSGKVDVLDHQEIVVKTMKKQDIFGEMSLIGEYQVDTTLKATEPTQVLSFDGQAFNRELLKYPPLQMFFARLLSKRMTDRLTNTKIDRIKFLKSGLAGDLSKVSIIDLFQRMNTEQKTGLLSIKLTSGNARLSFDKGDLVSARYLNFENQEAFFEIVKETQGSFSFNSTLPSEDIGTQPLGHFMRMLMEGLSRK